MSYIDVTHMSFKYKYSDDNFSALNDINFQIKSGEYVSIMGRNGAGKSTLARLLNAILLPYKGDVLIDGINTKDNIKIWDIRKNVGLVFQNPDNQIIGTTIKEEVAFGPENLGIHPKKIKELVEENLNLVGLLEYINNSANSLSGGQKQKLAIASVLAMEPQCIIFDEATSMIDTFERQEIMKIIKRLNNERGITILNITHFPQDALESDRLIVLEKGQILFDNTPAKVFSNVQELINFGIDVPDITRLFYELSSQGLKLPTEVSSINDALKVLLDIKKDCNH